MRVLVTVANALVAQGVAQALRSTIAECDAVVVDKRRLVAATRADRFAAAIVEFPWVSLATLATLRRHAPGCVTIALAADADAATLRRLARAGVGAAVPATASPAVLGAALRVAVAGNVTVLGCMLEDLNEPKRAVHRRRAGGLSLTERQLDVMALLARGAPNRVIASALGIGVRTVKAHVGVVLRALGVDNRADAGRVARRWLAVERRRGTGPAQSESAIR